MTAAVKLRNGAEVPGAAVSTTMVNLRECLESRPLAFYDLVMVCRREPEYAPFGGNGGYLRSLALLQQDGQPHEVIRDVVLSAVTGRDLDMGLGSPLPEVTA